ncbi:hypothetical protein NPIL_124351, partial [Nephila pilipes]
MKDALIAREKCNVIVVDYGQVECSYEEERIHLQNFGNDVAKFISNLVFCGRAVVDITTLDLPSFGKDSFNNL